MTMATMNAIEEERNHDVLLDDEDNLAVQNEQIAERIHKLKASVRKLTDETGRLSMKEGILDLGTHSADDGLGSNGTENDNPNLSSSESFALGMTLFGQDPVETERQLADRLKGLEEDLDVVVESLRTNRGQDTTPNDGNDESRATVLSQSSSEGPSTLDPAVLEAQSKQLRSKIAFLQLCNKARLALDESSALTSRISTNDPDYVSAAERVSAGFSAIEEAENMVRTESASSSASDPHNQALVGAYRVLDSIRTTARRKRADLISKAKTLLESSVDIQSTSITVKGDKQTVPQEQQASQGRQLDGIHAGYDVLEALSPDDNTYLDGAIKNLTDRLFHITIEPHLAAYKDAGVLSTSIAFNEVRRRHVHGLQWKQSDGSDLRTISTQIESWHETFEFLRRVIVFFQEHVLQGRERLCQMVGERLFGVGKKRNTTVSGNMDGDYDDDDDYEDNTLLDLQALGVESDILLHKEGSVTEFVLYLLHENCVPGRLEPSTLSTTLGDMRSSLMESISTFESAMARYKLFGFDGETPFGSFAADFEKHYVDKRRSTILNEAREILLGDDYHNTSLVGEDVKASRPTKIEGFPEDDGLDVFKLHKSAVSNSAVRIMQLCRRAMDEATDSTLDTGTEQLRLLPPTLYRAARETLDVFRAIIPSTLVDEIATVPRVAAVLHNDCVFFAHHCLTLGLEYKEKYRPPEDDTRGQTLRQICVFVDMVQPFRELADRSMGDMLEKQSRELINTIGPNIELLADALQSNESLSEWTDAEEAMTKALYQVERLAKVWKPVLADGVFSRSIGYLMDTIFNLYLDQVLKATGISEPASRFAGALFRRGMQSGATMLGNDTEGCRAWDRFSAVGRFMDMSLSDIQVALADGVFRSVTGGELSKLIVATFDDTQKRHNLLQALAKES